MHVDDIRNAIALRADMHLLFDEGEFVYVPKNGEMRLHFLFPTSTHSYMRYQNSPFPMTHISFQLLYARFAWAVFKHVVPSGLELFFDADGKPRDDGDTGGDGGGDGGGEAWGREDSDTGPGKRKQKSNPTVTRRSKRIKDGLGGLSAGEQVDSEDSFYGARTFPFPRKFFVGRV
jgi:hypothetical protein